MTLLLFLLLRAASADSPPRELLHRLSANLAIGSKSAVLAEFSDPSNGAYLFEMAANRGGLKKIRAAIIPSPPGWQEGYWAIFHTAQTIEEDHDPVYGLVRDGSDWKIGREIPEDETGGVRIDAEKYSARLYPREGRIGVSVQVRLRGAPDRAIPFRLNDNFIVKGNSVVAGEAAIPQPRAGDIVRAGSLLIPWTKSASKTFRFSYSAVLPKSDEDEITADDAYLTAWWLPGLGRLPFKVEASITGPKSWRLRAEGFETGREVKGAQETCNFRCDLPISFPKIVAGKYALAAKRETNGELFRVWQLAPLDKARAARDLASMIRAANFYRNTVGRLPFRGYECYDAVRYYGIESYSHTLLKRDATHFVSHEMGHSYFGGLAPCTYVHDSWNEGVTEYMDSVVLNGNRDKSLESALRTMNIPVPLSQMPIPWNFQDTTYWRGCYAMKMLEEEIGLKNVLLALHRIATERRGLDTRWADLRRYFEAASGRGLDWFWRQWIDGATFPKVEFTSQSRPEGKGFLTTLASHQSGTPTPFRMKLLLRVKTGATVHERVIDIRHASESFSEFTNVQPNKVELLAFPFALATITKLQSR